ncbi:unnamed protein product [Dibothriocephalus latus]|uniref:Apple domain-containing protein n=1 Tax=Dibothriocephalus latus TaxID=60516 RepID=A0A3P6QR57_DIBLA|nr:unnamed protein product [Dibothriocephalus latus]
MYAELKELKVGIWVPSFNNLAHVIENCRFACAIDQQCLGIEFVKGAFCTLIRKYRADKVIRQLGTLTERKPRACYAAQHKEFNYTYPYRKAVNHLKKQGKD